MEKLVEEASIKPNGGVMPVPNQKQAKMSKKQLKNAQKEAERRQALANMFNEFYRAEFGDERWERLVEALKQPVRHCLMLNKYSARKPTEDKLAAAGIETASLEYISVPCLVATTQTARLPPPSLDAHGTKDYYILDAGSVLATEALSIQPSDRVLDLCAAPGGKTVSILQRLGDGGHLTTNEVSPDRFRRLRTVVDEYAPFNRRKCTVSITNRDGTRWDEYLKYDKVLVDAPCSSERHLLHDDKEFQMWTAKRTANNATRQFQLLSAAVQAAKVGGLVLYGTCSISSQENDKVIDKVLQKSRVPLEIVPQQFAIGEATHHGWIVLPDVADGWGPLYFAVLRRTGLER